MGSSQKTKRFFYFFFCLNSHWAVHGPYALILTSPFLCLFKESFTSSMYLNNLFSCASLSNLLLSLLQDSAENEVDRNKCCTLCNMFFTSAIVAQSHYQGKTHAKRVRLVLGEQPSLPTPTGQINMSNVYSS